MVRVDRPGGAIGRCSALAELNHALNPPKTATRGHELARTAVRATAAHPAGMAAEPTPSPKSPKSTPCHVANIYFSAILRRRPTEQPCAPRAAASS